MRDKQRDSGLKWFRLEDALTDQGECPVVDLRPLIKSPRSPFFDWGLDQVERFLLSCGAEVAETEPHSRKPTDDTEGVLLFRELTPQNNIYIPLNGAIVFIERKPQWTSDEAEQDISLVPDEELASTRDLPLGTTVTLGDLVRNKFRYFGLIGPGQIAGLLELTMLLQVATGKRDRFSNPRRKELDDTYLPSFASKSDPTEPSKPQLGTRWFLSGFVSTHTVVLRVPVLPMMDLLLKRAAKMTQVAGTKDQEDKPPVPQTLSQILQTNEPEATTVALTFTRRCAEEIVFRESEQRMCHALLASSRHHIALAFHIFNYYARKGEREVRLKNERAAWYLNLGKDSKAGGQVLDRLEAEQIGKGRFFRRRREKGITFSFDSSPLEKYLMLQLMTELEGVHAEDERKGSERSKEEPGAS